MLPASTIPTDLHMFAPMVLENTNDAIMLVKYPPNATRGSIVYVNAAFTAQTGYTLDDVAGQAPRMLVSPDADPEALAELMSAVRSGQPIRTEVPNRTKDGRKIWIDLNVVPLKDPDGVVRHFISFRRDITAWKSREAALRKARELYRTVMDACLDAFFLLEPEPGDGGAIDFRVVEANRHAADELGLHIGALVKRDHAVLDRFLTSKELLDDFEAVASVGVPVEGVLSLSDDDVWIRYHVLKIGHCVAAVTRDVSETYRSSLKSAQAEAWLRDAIESIDQGLVLYDSEDALITCNQKFKDFHAVNADMLVPGAKYEDIIRGAISRGDWEIDAGDVEAWVSGRLVERRSKDQRTYVQNQPDGRVLRVDEQRTQNGGLVAVHADVTVAHQRERMLRQAKEQAEAANLSKSQFLATMSHELRTPLNAIIGFSEILRQGLFGTLDGKNLEYIADIHAAGRHLLALINDVLDMAKIEAGKYILIDEIMDLSDLIGECIRQIGPQVEHGELRVEYVPSRRMCPIRADRRALKQVLLNLLSNAVKFTPAGGLISVVTEVDEQGLAISVRDTGIGIPEEHLQRILRPFEQVENANSRRHEGTGLGLTITRHLVDLHGGTLHVQSATEGGTCVTIMLPAKRVLLGVQRAATA